MSTRSEVKTNMLENTIKVFLGLQMVLTATAVTDEENSWQVISNASSKEERGVNNGNVEQVNDEIDENKQLNENDSKNVLLNGDDRENEKLSGANEVNLQLTVTDEDKNIHQLNDKTLTSEEQERKGPKPLNKKLEKKEMKNKPWEFKYAVDKNDEPGFDLTPEEMKTFKIWKDGVIPYYIDVVSFSGKFELAK